MGGFLCVDIRSMVEQDLDSEVAAQVATVDQVKIAILAALNIADEFSRYRKQRLGAWIEKTEELSNRLNKVIS